MGCTPFLQIADVMAQEAGKEVQVVDSKEGVVNQALRVAPADSAVHCKAGSTDCTFFISGPSGIDEAPYKVLSKKLGIPYGGILAEYNV